MTILPLKAKFSKMVYKSLFVVLLFKMHYNDNFTLANKKFKACYCQAEQGQFSLFVNIKYYLNRKSCESVQHTF
jgi:hypothetical protein